MLTSVDSKEVRDMIIATGMETGAQEGLDILEQIAIELSAASSDQKPSAPTWRSVATRPSASRASADLEARRAPRPPWTPAATPAQRSTSSTPSGGTRRPNPGTRLARITS